MGGGINRRADYDSQVCLGAPHVIEGPYFGALIDFESKVHVHLAACLAHETTSGGETNGGPYPFFAQFLHRLGPRFFRAMDAAFRPIADTFRSASARICSAAIGLAILGDLVGQ